jgi:hypothetical protein
MFDAVEALFEAAAEAVGQQIIARLGAVAVYRKDTTVAQQRVTTTMEFIHQCHNNNLFINRPNVTSGGCFFLRVPRRFFLFKTEEWFAALLGGI